MKKKTIRIDNRKNVQVGDMLFVKGLSDGFRVTHVRKGSLLFPFAVDNPLGDGPACVQANRFDHADRTIEEPEWPDPHDLKLHVYLGADGRRYIYNPVDETDTEPWLIESYFAYRSREEMEDYYHDALPLVELKLVPKEEES